MDLEKGRVARQPVKKLSYVLANITRQARSKQDKYQQDDVKVLTQNLFLLKVKIHL